MKVVGGKPHYGEAIGILMFDGRRYPMVPGDVGNACTFEFPVRMKIVKGLFNCPPPPEEWPKDKMPEEVDRMIAAARELRDEGVRAIVTCCGFFTVFQDVLAREVGLPVFTSPLLLIPMLRRMIGPNKQIGVMTASKTALTEGYFRAAGVDSMDGIVISGLEESREFSETHMGGTRIEMDVDLLRQEVVAIARSCALAHPDLGAMVLECTTLPTFAADIQAEIGLPVFDYVGFIECIQRSVVQRHYTGFA